MTTSTLIPTQPKRERIDPRIVIGGTFEDIFESLTGVTTPVSFESREPIVSTVPEYVSRGFSSGSLEGFQNPRSVEKSEADLIVEQLTVVAEAENIFRQSRTEFIAAEEVRLEVAGMSETDRNNRLHLSGDYRKKNTDTAYHRAALYQQVKTDLSADLQQTKAPIPNPAKQPSALEGIFEGRSGAQGGGQANLSFQATG